MATVSALSYGSCLGCSLKSVNHEHAPTSGITATNMRPSKRAASPRSALIAHLHGPLATEVRKERLAWGRRPPAGAHVGDRKSTRLNSSHTVISHAAFC